MASFRGFVSMNDGGCIEAGGASRLYLDDIRVTKP